MPLEKVGNLGQVELMRRLLALKSVSSNGNPTSVTISKEEYIELEHILSDFQYVLSNLMMWENSLKNDQYGGLIKVIEDIKKKDLY
jgi:hypothetical protein